MNTIYLRQADTTHKRRARVHAARLLLDPVLLPDGTLRTLALCGSQPYDGWIVQPGPPEPGQLCEHCRRKLVKIEVGAL